MSAEVTLRIIEGPQKGRQFTFDSHDTFVFGRSAECHCSVPDDGYISSRHFLIEARPPECLLRDLGSKNGTRVNGLLSGKRIKGEGPETAAERSQVVSLHDGDRVKAGITEFLVSVCEPKPESPVVAPSEPGKLSLGPEADKKAGLVTDFFAAFAKGIGAEELPSIPGLRIEKELKGGAMGKVLLSRRIQDGKLLVVKVVRPAGPRGEATGKQIQRFKREMEHSLLDLEPGHKNIAKFVGSGLADDIYYFLMDYYPEGSIWDLMQRSGGTLSVSQAIELTTQALEGLSFAHERGVVHRDIKPENVLLHRNDQSLEARVADFGLARNFQRVGLARLTLSGDVGGTYAFMPKEQLMDFKKTLPVSDVFSMGAALYLMLTGEYVYEGRDFIVAVTNGRTVPISKRKATIPQQIAAVVDKAVAVEVRERYQTAAEFRVALMEAAKR